MADADQPVQRFLFQSVGQIAQFAFGAAAVQMPLLQRRDAGGIIAAIFEPLQGLDQ